MGERFDGNHFPILAADIKFEQILRLQAILRIRLNIDLKNLSIFIKLVHIAGADIGGERGKHVAYRDFQGFRLHAVNR